MTTATPTVSVTINDIEPATLRKIFKAIGIDPNSSNITVQANGTTIPLDGIEAPDWTPETARMFVEGLRDHAFQALQMVLDNGGVVSIDGVIEALGLSSGKALGGVMSSIGHNIRALSDSGLLAEDTRVVERNEEAREFRAVVPRRVRDLLTTAVHRRLRFEETRPQRPQRVA